MYQPGFAVHITIHGSVHMIGNWEISHVSESQRFVHYAHAYLDSGQLSCKQMVTHQAQLTWPNVTVVLLLSAHSVELFLKGAILGRKSDAKIHGHRIDLLSEQYKKLCLELDFAFEVPFSTQYPSISEAEIQALKKTKQVPSVFFRYPVEEPGEKRMGIHAFEAHGSLRILANVASAYERIGKAM